MLDTVIVLVVYYLEYIDNMVTISVSLVKRVVALSSGRPSGPWTCDLRQARLRASDIRQGDVERSAAVVRPPRFVHDNARRRASQSGDQSVFPAAFGQGQTEEGRAHEP